MVEELEQRVAVLTEKPQRLEDAYFLAVGPKLCEMSQRIAAHSTALLHAHTEKGPHG